MGESSSTIEAIQRELKKIPNLKLWHRQHGKNFDIHYSTANMIKNGSRVNLSHETVVKFCSALGINTVTDMVGGDIVSERVIKGIVLRDPNAARVIGEVVNMDVPDVLEMSELEARLILHRRDTSDPYRVFNILLDELALGRAHLPESDRAAAALARTVRGQIEGFLALRELQDETARAKKRLAS